MPRGVEARARIRLLGGFDLLTPQGAGVAISSRKTQGLLAILALSPGLSAGRDRLAGLLWGDRADEQARNSLRQALAALRKELGDAGLDLLEAERDQVRLVAERVSVDAAEMARLAGEGKAGEAAALYGGALQFPLQSGCTSPAGATPGRCSAITLSSPPPTWACRRRCNGDFP